jgi:hypothetical protein
MEGWIKLHRKMLIDPVFSNEKGLKVWIWCLLKANHKEKSLYIGRQKESLESGQFIFGRNKASEELEMSGSTIWWWMSQLEVDRYIDIKKTSKYSVVSILNWKTYQRLDSKVDNRSNHKKQQIDTNKNVKNVKNVKKYIHLKDLDEKDFQEIAEKYKVPVSFVISKYDDMELWVGEKAGRGRGRNWRLTLMNWVKRDAIKIKKEGYDKKSAIDARSIIGA